MNRSTCIENKNVICIVGAGMSGLLAALLVKKRRTEAQVVLVEHSAQAGGEYRGLKLDGFGYCDRGMRIIYETGIPEFDEILHNLLPEKDWHVLPDNQKDIVGLYWRGALQTHSPYIDLRRLSEPVRRQCEDEILHSAANGKGALADPNAEQYLNTRFGPTVTDYMRCAVQKLHKLPADRLHASATYYPAMNRVILYDQDKMKPVLQNEALRAVIAWPDQLTLPVKRNPSQSGLYPRRFGMDAVIDAAVRQLERQGTQFLFNRRVASMQISEERISGLTLNDGTFIENPSLVISASGLPGSLRMLRGDSAAPTVPLPSPSWLVFLRIASRPNMGPVYHFFCYDEKYSTFRVTNFSNYCPDACSEADYPISVELWSSDKDAAQAIARAKRELLEMGVVAEADHFTAEAAVPAPNFVGMCSLKEIEQFRSMRSEIKTRCPENMIVAGPLVEDGVTLLFDVWRKMYAQISERL